MFHKKPFPLMILPMEVRAEILKDLVVSPTPLEPSKHRFHPADFTAYETDAERNHQPSAVRWPNHDDFANFKIQRPHNLELAVLQVNRQLRTEGIYLFTRKNIISIRIREGNINVLGYMVPWDMDFLQNPKAHRDCSRFHRFQLHIEHEKHYIHNNQQRIRSDIDLNTAQIFKLWMILKYKQELEVFLGDRHSHDIRGVIEKNVHTKEIIKQSERVGVSTLKLNTQCYLTSDLPGNVDKDKGQWAWAARWLDVRTRRSGIEWLAFSNFPRPHGFEIREEAVWDMALAVNARSEQMWDQAFEKHNSTLPRRYLAQANI